LLLRQRQNLGCGLIKPETQSDCSELGEGKVGCGLSVVSGGDVPELLQLVDAAFDEVALPVFAL
jgi:hypothetical protein